MTEKNMKLQILADDILPPLKERLHKKMPLLRNRTIDKLHNFGNRILLEAANALKERTSPDVFDSDTDMHIGFYMAFVTALNEVLPLDYPYIFAVGHTYEEETWSGMRFITLYRRSIPGAHDLLTPGITPVIEVRIQKNSAEVLRFRDIILPANPAMPKFPQ